MRTPHFTKNGLLFAAATLLLSSSITLASRDAGHSKDYRTFHAGGKVTYGNIGDSYNAESWTP